MTNRDLKWIKESISTNEAPSAVGPYSQASAAGPLVFCSGQLGIVPGTRVLKGPTIEEQTRQAMENLAAVLDAAGSSLEMILKTTVYLQDIGDFPTFNGIYGEYFSDDPPARATLQADDLPLGALLEIEAIALRD